MPYGQNSPKVPQRSLISVSISVLSRAWKEKDLTTIDRIYKRSSLNLLLVSIFIFTFIWINYDNAVAALGLDAIYEEGKWVVFFLGLKNILDMGSGVNGQIIGTSTYWKFDFISGMVLLVVAVPLNIVLVREFGIIGAAWSGLGSYIIYNGIRIYFLWNKFRMQPFTFNTIIALVHAIVIFTIAYYAFKSMENWWGILLRSTLFVLLYLPTAYWLKISPDIRPVVTTFSNKIFKR